jgi:hypothetical protein
MASILLRPVPHIAVGNLCKAGYAGAGIASGEFHVSLPQAATVHEYRQNSLKGCPVRPIIFDKNNYIGIRLYGGLNGKYRFTLFVKQEVIWEKKCGLV